MSLKRVFKQCQINTYLGHHRNSGDAGTGGGNSEENSSFVSGGVGEKRTRYDHFFHFNCKLIVVNLTTYDCIDIKLLIPITIIEAL